MSFAEIAERFSTLPSSTDSFKVFYKSVFELMKTDAENAGLYFVVGIAAQSFVRNYEDQGLSAEFVDGAKALLVGMNDKLLAALACPADERLRVLGEIAVQYEWHVTDF
jgi:hypothetical protein